MKLTQRLCSDIIRDLLPDIPDTFTKSDVFDHWPEDELRNGLLIAATLRIMAKKRELVVVEPGLGGRAGSETVYAVRPTPQPERTRFETEWHLFREGKHMLFFANETNEQKL